LPAKCDTIDFWHVFYNKKKIGEFDDYSETRAKIVIKTSSINDNDSIRVKYFRDTPCDDCHTLLTIEDENNNRVLTSKGKGTFRAVSFAVKDLIEEKKRSGVTSFIVFYTEDQGGYSIDNKVVFRINLK